MNKEMRVPPLIPRTTNVDQMVGSKKWVSRVLPLVPRTTTVSQTVQTMKWASEYRFLELQKRLNGKIKEMGAYGSQNI